MLDTGLSMGRLTEASRSRRLLWLDYTAYAGRLLGGGGAPWLDTAACVAWTRKAQGLLRSDVVALPLGAVCDAWLQAWPAELQAIAVKARRAPGALRGLLADAPLRAHLADLVPAMRAAFGTTLLVLAMPSPRDWLAQALRRVAPGAPAGVDDDHVDAAASYMADFLRSFATHGVDALLLEANAPWAAGPETELELMRPVSNVARHYGWDLGLRLPEAMALPKGDPGFVIAPAASGSRLTGLAVPAAFWSGSALPDAVPGSFDFAEIPAAAQPEAVLQRLALLRERPATW